MVPGASRFGVPGAWPGPPSTTYGLVSRDCESGKKLALLSSAQGRRQEILKFIFRKGVGVARGAGRPARRKEKRTEEKRTAVLQSI